MSSKKAILRQFLYLDPKLLRDLLEQVPGGTYRDLRGERQTQGSTNFGGSLGLGPAHATAARDKATTERTEFEVRQSEAADFSRLYDVLEGQELIQHLDAVDDEIWEQLHVHEFLEVPVQISEPKILDVLRTAELYKQFLPHAQALGLPIPDDSGQMLSQLDIVNQLFSQGQRPIIMKVAGFPRYKFTASLLPASLRADISQVVGAATVLGKIQRKIRKGQTATTVELMRNIQQMNRATARRRGQEPRLGRLGTPDNFTRVYELEIPYPVAVMTPIAIYR